MDEVREYCIGRDKAIVESIGTDSVEPFKRFVNEWKEKGLYPDCFALPNDEVLAISIRQMALHCTDIKPEIKGRAVDWLTSRGHHLDFTD